MSNLDPMIEMLEWKIEQMREELKYHQSSLGKAWKFIKLQHELNQKIMKALEKAQ